MDVYRTDDLDSLKRESEEWKAKYDLLYKRNEELYVGPERPLESRTS